MIRAFVVNDVVVLEFGDTEEARYHGRFLADMGDGLRFYATSDLRPGESNEEQADRLRAALWVVSGKMAS